MYKLIFATLMVLGMVAASTATYAQARRGIDRPVVAVTEFRNDTSAGWWRSRDVGMELSNMLGNELAATGVIRVLDRKHLGTTLAEQDLAASGRVRQGSGPATGDVIGAQYLIQGTVTSYSEQTSRTGGGISFKGFRIGGKHKEAYIAIDLQVVDAQTGEVAFVRTVEGRSSGGGVDLGVFRHGFGGSLSHEKNTPTGKAIRAALVESTDYLACAMYYRDGCMNKYQARDMRRRDRTRSVIKLD